MTNKFMDIMNKGRNLVPMEKRNIWVVYVVILIAATLDNLNVSAAFVSTFNIQETFDTDLAKSSWFISAYSFTLGSFIIFFGKMADILGPHNIFLAGLFFMWLFSLIVAVIDTSIIAAIVFRALQGVAGAAMMPSAYAMTANYFMGTNLALALKGLMLALTLSPGVGMVFGGAFSETLIGYKGFYYTSFGIGFTCFLFLFFFMIPVKETAQHKEMKLANLDFQATFGVVVGMLLIILSLTQGGSNWKDPSAYVPLPIGVLLLAAVAVFEVYYISKYQDKYTGTQVDNWKTRLLLIFPKKIFQLTNFWPLITILVSLMVAWTTINLVLVDFHLLVMGDSPILTSVKLLPLSAGIVVMAFIFKFEYANKVGYGYFVIFANVVCLSMAIWISRIDYKITHSYWIYEFVPLFLYGLTFNGYFHVYFTVIMVSTPLHLQANCSGIFQGSAQLGIALASAVFSTIMGDVSLDTDKDVLQKKISHSMYFLIAVSAVGVIAACFIKQHDLQLLAAEANFSTPDDNTNVGDNKEDEELFKKIDIDVEELNKTNSSTESSKVEV